MADFSYYGMVPKLLKSCSLGGEGSCTTPRSLQG